VTQSQKRNMVCTYSYMDFTQSKGLPAYYPENLGNKEDSKSDIHGSPEKGKGTRSPEQIGSMEREERELGE
ncbi:hypothetical protein ACQP3D_27055, partial [Escherichia coli]